MKMTTSTIDVLCCILLEISMTDHYSLSQNCIIIHMKYMYLSYVKELSFSNHDKLDGFKALERT